MNIENVAAKPPMGWNSWDCYGAGVTEKDLLANAEYMRDNLKKFGWTYIVCDIQWYEPTASSTDYHNFTELCMDEYSRLIPAVNRFPSSAGGKGFSVIASKIHDMGLKFGIHIMRGIPRQAVHRNTDIMCEGVKARDIASQFSLCPWNTDMYGVNAGAKGAAEYYDSLFGLYASWGVDFVKVDDICNTEFDNRNPYSAKKEIELIRNAIDKCGRDMVLSLSPGPATIENAYHLSQNANMWRLTGDFWDEWDKLKAMFKKCELWYTHVGNGRWPDCDMLPLGMLNVNNPDRRRYTRFTPDEQKMLMTLWSIFRSPLIFGGNLPDNNESTDKLLMNKYIIDVNQNSYDNRPLVSNDDEAVWICSMPDGSQVVALFNLTDETRELGVPEQVLANRDNLHVYNLWNSNKISDTSILKCIKVCAHSAEILKIC